MTVGKDTAAQFVLEQLPNTVQVNFADEVKKIAREQFGWDGIKDERGRRLLQYIGTECGRLYNENIWVEKLAKAISNRPENIVISDARFLNEVAFVNSQPKGLTVLIDAPDEKLQTNGILNHASETELFRADWQIGIINEKERFDAFYECLTLALTSQGVPLL